MTLEKQHEALIELEKEIDKRLKNTDFAAMKELLLFLAQSKEYHRFKDKELKITLFDMFTNIWLEEKKKLADIGIDDDIFYNISSIDDVENKYQNMLCMMLRFETEMPEEYYDDAIDVILANRLSGIALGKLAARHTADKIGNAVKICRRLHARGETVRAIFFLQTMEEYFPEDKDILVELAGYWMDGQQLGQALECLKKIKKPDDDIKSVIDELEKVLGQ